MSSYVQKQQQLLGHFEAAYVAIHMQNMPCVELKQEMTHQAKDCKHKPLHLRNCIHALEPKLGCT